MRAVGDYVIVHDDEIQQTNDLGLVITEQSDNNIRYTIGKVVTVGGDVKEIKAKSVVYFDKMAGSSFRYKGDRYKAIRERDVVITVDEDSVI